MDRVNKLQLPHLLSRQMVFADLAMAMRYVLEPNAARSSDTVEQDQSSVSSEKCNFENDTDHHSWKVAQAIVILDCAKILTTLYPKTGPAYTAVPRTQIGFVGSLVLETAALPVAIVEVLMITVVLGTTILENVTRMRAELV